MKLFKSLVAGALWALPFSVASIAQDTPPDTAQPPAAAGEETSSELTKPLAGYLNHEALTGELWKLNDSPQADLASLGKTIEGRDIWLLTVGQESLAAKPAILVVGNVDASHLVGTELALRMAKQLVERAGSEEPVQQFLERYSVYIIPSPSPDASEKNFTSGQREHRGNAVKTDDDRDFEVGEDPPIDLDGNGAVTMMRIADSVGTHRPHPDDPRVMIEVDAKKNEAGSYRLMVESKDADQDGSFGEDASDGVEFNRNFTFEYDYFGKGSGVNQVSEIETRAIVDFCYEHPNIIAVLSFSNQDNLYHPWKTSNAGSSGRIRTSVLSDDAPLLSFIAEQFQELHGGKNAPAASSEKGSFVEWAYYHYGRWSFASRGWWIPEVKVEEKKEQPEQEELTSSAEEAKAADTDKKKESSEKRGQDELNALRWLASQSIDGFSDWTPIEHPDFPGKTVEVGGFLPFARSQPPVALIDEVAKPHVELLLKLAELFPRIEFRDAEIKPLGRGFFEVKVDLVNTAYLPTMSEMGSVNGEAYPIVVEFDLPTEAKLIQGDRKTLVRKLDGRGGKREMKWLVRFEQSPESLQVPLSASAPTISATSINIEFKN